MANVHCLIDEAGSIGRMESLKDVLNVGRGFGLRLQLYYQDTGQLNSNWENPQGVLANTTKIFFSTQSYEAAEIISKSLGPQTITVESGGTNSGWSRNQGASRGGGSSASGGSSSFSQGSSSNWGQQVGSSYSTGGSQNWQQQSRELLKPDEILTLDPRIAITLTPGMRPIWTKLLRYYEEKSLLRHRGLLRRMAAACRTFVISALLLILAAASARALTNELRGLMAQQRPFQVAPTINQLPWVIPDQRRR